MALWNSCDIPRIANSNHCSINSNVQNGAFKMSYILAGLDTFSSFKMRKEQYMPEAVLHILVY